MLFSGPARLRCVGPIVGENEDIKTFMGGDRHRMVRGIYPLCDGDTHGAVDAAEALGIIIRLESFSLSISSRLVGSDGFLNEIAVMCR